MNNATRLLPDGSTATPFEARNRPYFVARPCEGGCGKRFAKRDVLIVVEEQASISRGDDKVTGWCPECFRRVYGG